MRKEKEFLIQGKKIKITHLEFGMAMDILTLLSKNLIGPAGSLALSGESASGREIAVALKELAQTLNAEDLKTLISAFAQNTKIEERGVFIQLEPELHLAGANLSFLPKWIYESVVYNYLNFFKEVGLGAEKAGLAQVV